MKIKELLQPIDNLSEYQAYFKEMPLVPNVYWYVSAGMDFRGPVYLTDYHINHLKRHHQYELKKPDLYVFNCLGDEIKELIDNRDIIRNGAYTVYADGRTEILVTKYVALSIDREKVNYQINPQFVEKAHVSDPMKKKNHDAALLRLKIKSLSIGFEEEVKVIYLQMENINCFHEFILKHKAVNVQYLCTIREGLAWGNCKRSMIKEIYNTNHHYLPQGFNPEYVITFNDFTKSLFLDRMKEQGRQFKELPPLPPENQEQWEINNSVFQILNSNISKSRPNKQEYESN